MGDRVGTATGAPTLTGVVRERTGSEIMGYCYEARAWSDIWNLWG